MIEPANSIPQASNRGARRWWLFGVLGWLCLALLISSTICLSGFRPLSLILKVVTVILLPAGLLTPPVFWLARVFPISLATWKSNLGKHIVASAIFCLICATLSGSALVVLQPQVLAAYNEQWKRDFPPTPAGNQDPAKSAVMFLPPGLRSGKFDLPTVLTNSVTNLPPYWVLVLLAHALNASARLREREQQAAELAAHLAQARLEGLRTQLQPHFLFNTLNSISALIPQNAKLANEMVLNLADLLRMTLRDPQRTEISLGEELKLLGHYVDIQKLRFGQRLIFQLDAAAACLRFPVPPLLLQPLVENAIRHGVEPSEQPETILVRVQLLAQTIALEVTNSCHCPTESLGKPPASTGVGLANTRARLAALYGTEQSLNFGSLPNGGFRVSIRLPARAGSGNNYEN